MTNTIYLSGPPITLNDPSIPISADWKSYAASTFIKSGITVANPLELDLKGFISSTDESSDAVKHSLTLIDRADSLLANITQLSESAAMEMVYAHRQGKQVVVLGNEPYSPWVLFHSEARFNKLKEALNYLVNQPAGFDIISWSAQFEETLKRKSEEYPPQGELDFEYYGGSAPILLLAPHATAYFNQGNWHPSESYTGSLAVLLHKLTGCHALISSYCMAADPVFNLNSPYVNFLNYLSKKINFKLVLMLHGNEIWRSPHEIIVSSFNNSSLINKTEYLNLLISMLKVKDFKEIGFNTDESNEIKTINHLLFQDLKIPVIQLNVHKRYRQPRLHQSHYKSIQTALAQFIMLVGN